MYKYSKTKLICTIGPASNSREIIKKMIENGMNVARLNFSHGNHDSHRATIKLVREVAKELGVYVGILQDLCGPKIRLGNLPEDGIRLIDGSQVVLADSSENCSDCIPVDYVGIHKELEVGERILIADGLMDLIVTKIDGVKIYCKVVTGGIAFSRKGVNMPQSNLQVSAFSQKDRADLLMGLEEKVDFVAMRFVRSANDLKEIKSVISESNYKPRLIAKIEKPQAVDNLDEILDQVDGVMVARGETTDVANAVLDGTDALMLSDETANGKYPELAVETLSKIARAAEPHTISSLSNDTSIVCNEGSLTKAIGRAACWLAKDVNASAIICYTAAGYAAYSISMFRPNCKIIALTNKEDICSKMSLIWGTTPMLTEEVKDTDNLVAGAVEIAKNANAIKKGDKVVITAGLPFGQTYNTSFIRIVEVE